MYADKQIHEKNRVLRICLMKPFQSVIINLSEQRKLFN